MRVVAVVPTYNECDNIKLLCEGIMAVPLATGTHLGVLIVDDNSPDGTGAVADALAERFPGRINVLHRLTERGRASAGIAGFKRALADPSCTHIVEMDADFSHHPDELPKMIDACRRGDIVIGSRYVSGGTTVNCRMFNRVLSITINLVNRVLLGVPVRDSSGGYKIYARKVLSTINLDNYVSTAYSVGVETLLKCKRNGFSFIEVPITFRNRERGASKMDRKVITEYPRTLLKLKWLDLRGGVR
jgi:dolichol-phosphate mannosyltransferase